MGKIVICRKLTAMLSLLPFAGLSELYVTPTVTDVRPGQAINVSETSLGDEVTVAEGDPGVITKTGAGMLYVSEIPEGTKTLLVREGSLTLAAPSAEWELADDDHVYVTVDYPTLMVPVKGRYDLKFKVSGAASECEHFDVLVGNDESSLTQIGYVRRTAGSAKEYSFRTPYLMHGVAALKFQALDADLSPVEIDVSALFCDVSLELVHDHDFAEWVIPGGDFENARIEPNHTFKAENAPPEWTLSQGKWASSAYPSAGVAFSGANVDSNFNVYRAGQTPYGNAALAIFDQDSTATTTFYPPEGTYKLSFRYRKWDGGTWNGRYINFNSSLNNNTGIRVVLAVNGVEVGREFLWPTQTSFTLGTCNTAISVREGDAVTLTLSQYSVYSAVVMDDFVLVRQSEADLVSNGGFESVSGSQDWQGVSPNAAFWSTMSENGGNDKSAVVDTAAWKQDMANPPSYPFTHTAQKYFLPDAKDGQRALLIRGAGKAEQTISFKKAGLYRLTCSLHSRMQSGSIVNGCNPLRFELKDGEVKQTLAETTVPGEVWLDKSCLFRVKKAGDHVLVIQGLDTTGKLTSFVDALSIVAVGEDELMDSVSLPADLAIKVESGASLCLAYPGTSCVRRLKLPTGSVVGNIDATHESDVIWGVGTLSVQGKDGFTLSLR